MSKRRTSKISLVLIICLSMLFLGTADLHACTTVMAGREATEDGSVMFAAYNEGQMASWYEIMEPMEFDEGEEIPMYYNRPLAETLDEHKEHERLGFEFVDYLTVPEEVPEKTNRVFFWRSRPPARRVGGVNEHGVIAALEWTPMEPILSNPDGKVSAATNHWTSSVIANGLMQAESAREAIEVMGEMVEEYGFCYFLDPMAGLGVPIADQEEAWIFEVAGPGPGWTPDSDEPGAVWVAQRVPDDEFFVHFNHSRPEEIDLEDEDHFMASDNIFSLAEELNLWDPDEEPFSWKDVYGRSLVAGSRAYDAYNRVAPSKEIEFHDARDEDVDEHYPFSVKPDEPVTLEKIKEIMRSTYENTEFDMSEHEAFEVDGEKSPLARTHAGYGDLFDLLEIDAPPRDPIPGEGTNVFMVGHLRDWMPKPLSTVTWTAPAAGHTSVLTPVFAGIEDLPLSWQDFDWEKVNRDHASWNFTLVHNISYYRYQEMMEDIEAVIEPAEEKFSEMLPAFEDKVIEVYEEEGEEAANELVTEFSNHWLQQTHYTYDELVDYLLYKYFFIEADQAHHLPDLPEVVPDLEAVPFID